MHIFRTQRQALQGLKYGSSYCCMMRTGMRINLSNVIVQLTHTSPSSEPGMFNGPSCLVILHCLIGPARIVNLHCLMSPTRLVNLHCLMDPARLVNLYCLMDPARIVNLHCLMDPERIVNPHCLMDSARFVQHIEIAWLGVKYLYLGHK